MKKKLKVENKILPPLMVKKPFPSQNSSTTITSMQDRAKLIKTGNKKKQLIGKHKEGDSKSVDLKRVISKESDLAFDRSKNDRKSEMSRKNSENFCEKQNMTRDSKDSDCAPQRRKPNKLQINSGICN